jgi:hypothetical protein
VYALERDGALARSKATAERQDPKKIREIYLLITKIKPMILLTSGPTQVVDGMNEFAAAELIVSPMIDGKDRSERVKATAISKSKSKRVVLVG